MGGRYHEGSRRLQERFDTVRLADRIEERRMRETIDEDDRAFIESADMFFLATADADGRPQCSYKGGDPGFVRVVDERTIAFPSWDGNGMYLSAGNVLVNPHVGLLFIDFERRSRLRLNGVASIDDADPLLDATRRRSSWCACARRRCSRTARATSTSTGSSSAHASRRTRTPRRRHRRGSASTGRVTCSRPATRRSTLAPRSSSRRLA